MKILLDENLPVKLKFRFSAGFTVYTVNDMKWNSLKSGELMKVLDENHFDVFITSDKNIVHQHKLTNYNFKLLIISVPNNRYETIRPLVPEIENRILTTGEQVIRIEA